MKALLITLLFSILSSANTQLKVDKFTSLHTYNHKPSMKLKEKRKFRTLSNIKRDEAIEIATSICHEDMTSQKLTHRGQLLFYRIYTKTCKVEINALDGAIISKVLL